MMENKSRDVLPFEGGNELKKEVKKKYATKQWILLITLCFGHFTAGSCVSLQGPFFPQEAEKKGATPTEYGLIFGSYQLSMFFCSPLCGKIISLIRPKKLLILGVSTVGTTCVAFGFLDWIEGHIAFVVLAFLIRILEGVGAAAFRVSSHTIAAMEFPENVTTTYALLRTSTGIGLIAGPMLGAILYSISGYQLPFYVVGSVILLDAFVVYVVLPTPECKKREVGNGERAWKFWQNPGVMMYFMATFTPHCYIGYNNVTLEPHLRQFNLSPLYVGLLFALYATIFAMGSPLWGWLCDRKEVSRILLISGCICTILSLILIGPMPFLHIHHGHLIAIIISLLLMGLGAGLKLVSAFSGCIEHAVNIGFPKSIATYGLIASMGAAAQSLGAFVGPSVGGFLMENIGYHYSTLFVLSLEIITLLMILLHSQTNSSEKEELICNTL